MTNKLVFENVLVPENDIALLDNDSKILWCVNRLKTSIKNNSDSYKDIQLLIYSIVDTINIADVVFEFNQNYRGRMRNMTVENQIVNIQAPILLELSNRLQQLKVKESDIEFLIRYIMHSQWLQRIVKYCLGNASNIEL